MSVRIRFIGQPILEQVIRGKRTLRSAVESELKPSHRLMRLIGEEIIHGFQGKSQITNVKFGPRGGIYYTRGTPYPYGIFRQKSPDGRPYKELSKVTVKIKKESGSSFPTKALLDTGAMAHSLQERVYVGDNGVEVHFSSEADADKSLKMERGGNFISKSLANKRGGMRKVFVPARSHRPIQDAVRIKIQQILQRWAEKSEKI
jgi:hypothetical protein